MNLTINSSTAHTTVASVCDSYTWDAPLGDGSNYTIGGIYTNTTTNSGGCPHTETLNLTITPSTTNTTTASACDSYTWSVNGTTYTTGGTYIYVNGCDTQILDLTITPSTTITTSVSACDSYTWSVDGNTYSSTGTYTFVNGCDTQVLDLTINTTTSHTTVESACDSYTWDAPLGDGSTYTIGGIYTNISTNAGGCTHTETLNLTITPSTTNTTTESACGSYTWSVNGTTYTTGGTYTYVNGCDTQILDLTITPSTTNTTTASACDSYTWSVSGTTYTVGGTYTFVNGCSTEVLDLTINAPATPTGSAAQTLLDTDTVSNIVVSPSTVVWYSSLADALAGTNAISNTTVVVNGSTYYAVNISGSCNSTPFAVTITTTLSNADFDNLNFNYYPNPTADILNITYNNDISEVSVTNTIGQVVLVNKTNSNNVQMDLSDLPAATYFVKVVSEGKEKTVKVIKK